MYFLAFILCFATPILASEQAPIPASSTGVVYIIENLDGGRQLRLSDGNLYDVDPEDVNIASVWVSPSTPLRMEDAGGNYPIRLRNVYTGSSIYVRPH